MSSLKAFVSSTFEDLKDHRAQVITQLNQMGIHVDPMEEWTASSDQPKELSRRRAADCDFCILLVAHRRGFVPDGEELSITQMEYEAACELGIAVIPFLLSEDALWPAKFVEKDPHIVQWREHLMSRFVVGEFATDPKSINVSPAVARWMQQPRAEHPEKLATNKTSDDFTCRVVGSNFQDLVLFKNREEQIETLRKFLFDSRGEKLLAIVGRSGTGKTALLSRFCQKIEINELGALEHDSSRPEESCVNGLVYFDCRGAGQQTVELIYHQLCELLPPDERIGLRSLWSDTSLTDAERFRNLFQKLQEGIFVLALDNFEETLSADHGVADESLRVFLDELLTRPHNLRVIATSSSRILLGPATLAHVQMLPMDKGLPNSEGVQLLRELDASGDLGLRDADEETLSIAVDKCFGLPPALYGICSLLETDLTLTLADLIRDEELFNDQLLHKLAQEQYHRLSNDKAKVVESLAIFSRPAREDAITAVVRHSSPRVNVRDCLRDLALSHLVTVSRHRQTFELQGILSSYAYAQIPTSGPDNRRDRHSAAASHFSSVTPPEDTWRSIQDVDPLLCQFEHNTAAEEFDDAAEIVDRIDEDYLQRWGHYRTIIAMRQRLLNRLDRPELRQSNLGNLALVLRRIGRANEAVNYLRQAIEASETAGLPLASINWHCELGNTYADLVQMPAAIDEYKVATKIALENGHPHARSRPLGNLAIAYRQLGDAGRALEYYEQAIAISDEAIVSVDDPAEKQRLRRLRAIQSGNRGSAYLALGDEPRARKCYQATADFMKADGYSYSVGVFSGHIGRCWLHEGDYIAAIDQFQEAIDMLLDTGEHRSTSYFYQWMGEAYHHLGKIDSAEQSYLACERLDASVECSPNPDACVMSF